jgi:hypothetical protein
MPLFDMIKFYHIGVPSKSRVFTSFLTICNHGLVLLDWDGQKSNWSLQKIATETT